MRDPLTALQTTEGVDQLGDTAYVEVEVRHDGRIALTSSTPAGEPILFSSELAARLRNQIGDALTVSLRDARTTRRCNTP
jgi:hypothetical protein